MNAYPVRGAQSWNANTDLKLIYNIDCLCQYLCAYACKPEGTSKAVLTTLKRCAELAEEDGRDVVGPSIRSAFIRAHGQRDMSAQVYMRVPLNARMYVTSTFVRAGTCSLQRECV
jgi:Cdc6-like AAA superfamily ATPase